MTTQKRPQNCGTSYCSCIEYVMEPDYKALWKQMCERCDELDKKLAQLEHLEPVAWKLESGQAIWFERTDPEAASALPPDVTMTPLYTTPPPVAEPHKRKPLTYQKIRDLWARDNWLEDCDLCKIDDFIAAVRFVEAAHGIKENT